MIEIFLVVHSHSLEGEHLRLHIQDRYVDLQISVHINISARALLLDLVELIVLDTELQLYDITDSCSSPTKVHFFQSLKTLGNRRKLRQFRRKFLKASGLLGKTDIHECGACWTSFPSLIFASHIFKLRHFPHPRVSASIQILFLKI